MIKVQSIIQKHAKEGYACIILGDADHPEVIGLRGYAADKGYVVADMAELEALPAFDRAIVVAQTTQNQDLFAQARKWAGERHRHYKVFNTICDSTEQRQEEVKRLAAKVDAVVVVGGLTSGNTQRLAEIAKASGKPAFHVETEAELDAGFLAGAGTVGLTAGASTPTWVIKRLYRAIETLSDENGNKWRRRQLAVQHLLLMSHLYVALGAGCLCLACSKLQGLYNYLPYLVISMLYVLSMHILNTLTGLKEARYNDPERAAFYDEHKVSMVLLALVSGALGLLTAAGMGLRPFVVLLVMSLLGLSYNLKLIPDRFPARYRRMREIPGSKAALIAVAWGVVTALFPCLAIAGGPKLAMIPAFLFATGMAFCRTGFFNVLDMQGDRIAGAASLAIVLGKDRCLRLLKVVLVLVGVILFLATSYDIVPSLGYYLLVCPAALLLIVQFNRRADLLPGLHLEFLTDSLFVLAGVITFGWWLAH